MLLAKTDVWEAFTPTEQIIDQLMAVNSRRVIVVIPACQEAATIASTIRSIQTQSTKATMIIVAANNCSDGTELVASKAGAVVFDANPNSHKKAGALNIVLEAVVPVLDDEDVVLVADADTTLSGNFIEDALKRIDEDVTVGAVSGAFMGRPSEILLGTLQQMEFYRYLRQIHRNGERAFVVSGTGGLFRVSALRSVRAEREKRHGRLPSGESFYCIRSMTEDNEITLALLALGWKCVSPADIQTTTDVMETPRALWKQRERWYLGALWNLHDYGRKMPWHMRWVYWRQQFGLGLSFVRMMLNGLFLVLTVAMLSIQFGDYTLICLGASAVVWVQQVASVWKMGRKARILALAGVDQFYSIYLLIVFSSAFGKFVRRNRGGWTLT